MPGKPTAGLSGLFGLSWFGTALTASGVATLVYGELMALRQNDIKRMLAYSTLGQIGEIALVLGLGTWLATAGALWHVLNHAVMKDLLFLGAGALIMRAGSRNLEDLRGLGRCMPWTVACMAVGLVSIMGLPPFGSLLQQISDDPGGRACRAHLARCPDSDRLPGGRHLLHPDSENPGFCAAPGPSAGGAEAPFSMRLSLLVLAALSLLLGLAPQLPMQLVLPVASLCFAPTPGDPQIIMALSVYWPVYVLLPVFGALLPALFAGRRKPAGWTSVAVLLVTALLVALYGRDLDTLSFCFALIVPLIGALNMAYAVGYMEHSHSQWRFYCAFTCMCGGLVGMAASQYLLSFFLFWEIMSSWTLYMAIAQEGDKASLREAFKYFFFNLLGAGFLFVGLCVLGPFTPFTLETLTLLLARLVSGRGGWAWLCWPWVL